MKTDLRRRRSPARRATSSVARTTQQLRQRLRFESELAELSAAFARAPGAHVEQLMDAWLKRLTELIKVDRSTFFRFSSDGRTASRVRTYSALDLGPLPPLSSDMHWTIDQLRRGHPIVWARIPRDIPRTATAERALAKELGTKSLLIIPASTGGTAIGALGFACMRAPRAWPNELIQRLRLAGEVFANALLRAQLLDSQREAEQRMHALLRALPDMMFVVSEEGVYLDYHAPQPWQFPLPPQHFLGKHITEILEPSLAASFFGAFERARAADKPVELEFALHTGTEKRHYEARIVAREDHALVCIVRDITQRVHGEGMAREIERLRFDLAHVARVSLVGQLMASLVHELGQPLTAMLSNGEAAKRLLEKPQENLGEMSELFDDVIASGQRAMEVIKRLRSFLRKGELQRRMVDVNRLVGDVVLVMKRELTMRQIELMLKLEPHVPEIPADRVQLQQVIFNLLLNAADAMSGYPHGQRRIVLYTRTTHSWLEIAIEDHGSGIDPADLANLFHPFFSKKEGGMGMGLAICADIVGAHGGTIWAENNSDGGATFYVSLPVAPGSHKAKPADAADVEASSSQLLIDGKTKAKHAPRRKPDTATP